MLWSEKLFHQLLTHMKHSHMTLYMITHGVTTLVSSGHTILQDNLTVQFNSL